FSSSDDSVAVLNNSPTRRGQASVVGAVDDSATVTANFPTTAFQADGTLFVGLFAYVLSDLDSLVQPLIVDPDTGALTDTDGSAQGDDSPGEFVIHPNGLFLYVVNLFTEMVTVYEIDPDTGALNHVQDFPVDDCGCGTVLVVEPTGHRLYLVDSNIGQVKVLDIDLADGSLTDSGISEITGSFVEDAEMTPDGRFLQVLDLSDNVIYTYEIDPATGAPMPPTTTPTGGETPFDLAIDPLGRFLFVISDAGRTLESSLLDPFTGLPAAPFQFSISDQLMGMAVDPQGQTLVAGATALGGRARAKRGCAASREMVVEGCGCPDDLVYTFTIDPCDGFLDQTGTTATSPAPAGLAVDPRGRFAWTSSDFGEVVSGFALNREDFTAAPLDPRDLMLPELFFLLQMETTP
ncbi:MAG: beta-propeller fold lactonase family protein, partial [Phycisphaerales bacterium]|nr:beta-propeller fold lactonase family protein [Phycisphaerales bacterium]